MALVNTGAGRCPDCGISLTAEPWGAGLCLSCLLELGLTTPAAPVDDDDRPGDLPTVSATPSAFIPGQILGNRYRIRSRLGSGGMGEVFRAFDLKLRVDLALKAVRPTLLADEWALNGLRQEVRAAREVVSPNVCRVFDLVEFDGQELVSMEYVDGVTLADVLRERSPLTIQEAREIASQFLAGLDAIHAAGLVHRDIKPENLMLTRAGRVVIMDFGIARAVSPLRGQTVSGTPAYMAPEQARGESGDARGDVFSAGIVLAEMVAPGGVRDHRTREAVWCGVHAEPPDVGNTPWAVALRRAVLRTPDQRYPTAAALARALEEITLRTSGEETLRPYPGLASFTERDAGYFVGRELEIEEMWKKLGRPHLLALIGPSGAGKSSFLRAGLGQTAPPDWRIVFATPRDRPFASLAHALAPELSGDVEAVARLIDFEQSDVALDVVARWRRRHGHALLIIDQFEELFTQSQPDVQDRFAELLARLALEADVHVLLSMRDDFLLHCHKFESLAPIFSHLTAIGPPTGAALRRALVQPALKCGYRFEDESVIEEMLAQVAGERGALPLVAFAMSRLWDTRDRERGLLTRAAYAEIGGVGGALAQHADATIDRIGQDRIPIVRELFRNLVTSQGTRATLDRDELLSVFADAAGDAATGTLSPRRQAAEVLDALIDARLLTSYEQPSDGGDSGGHRRIEIVHESLLTAWPRLVRWQTQDQDGAQLRDQLRQAARLWEERATPDDLLWTGTSLREYELWRERYAGTLTASEDKFTRAMTARARRRRSQRLVAAAAVLVAAVAVAAAMGVLWRQSEGARSQALAAARHAEAQQLFTLGQLELQRHPGAALAYALASLERADSAHARLFAVRALSQGPAPFALSRADSNSGVPELRFSKNSTWLTAVNVSSGAVRVWRNDGSAMPEIPGSAGTYAWGEFTDDEQAFVLTKSDAVRVYSLPAAKEIRRMAGSFRWGFVRGQSVITGSFLEPTPDGGARRLLKSWPLHDDAPETTLGIWTNPPGTAGTFAIDRAGQGLLGIHDGSLYEIPLNLLDRGKARVVVRADDEPITAFFLNSDGSQVYTLGKSGVVRVSSRESGDPLPSPHLVLPPDRTILNAATSDDGRWLAITSGTEAAQLWNLDGPVNAEPLTMRLSARTLSAAIDSTSSWLALQDYRTVTLWPLTKRHPDVLRAPDKRLRNVVFDPRGQWIAAGGEGLTSFLVWAMHANFAAPQATRDSGSPFQTLAVSPRGDLLAGAGVGVWLVPLQGGRPEQLPGFKANMLAVAFTHDGKRLAAGGGLGGELMAPGESVIRIWDLDTREVQILDAGDGKPIMGVEFMPGDDWLLATGPAGLRQWDLKAGTSTLLVQGVARAVVSPDGRRVLGVRAQLRPGGIAGTVIVYDLQTGQTSELPSHGTEVSSVAWHPDGRRVVTGGRDGLVRIGNVSGEEPHLLMGHEAPVWSVAVESSGHRIASTGDDGTVRLWPIPEGQPFHTLPADVLLERLRSLTNYRIVADSATPSGYRLDFEPFTGWNRKPPTW